MYFDILIFWGGEPNEIASTRYLVTNYLSKVLETVYSANITSPSSEKSFRSLCILILKVHGSYIFIFSVWFVSSCAPHLKDKKGYLHSTVVDISC